MEEKKSVILAENNERQRQPLEKHGGTIMRNTITEVDGIRKKKYKAIQIQLQLRRGWWN